MMDDDLFTPHFDLGAFRHIVARYVKLLIRARWKCNPGFLDANVLKQWKLENIGDDALSASALMTQAAYTLGKINIHFIPRCDSGGVSPHDDNRPELRLLGSVAFLVTNYGGGPEHNYALYVAAKRLGDGDSIEWTKLIDWETLPSIRSDLDLLPEPRESQSSEPTTVGSRCICRRKGQDWEVKFHNGSVNLYGPLDGFLYLSMLLRSPGRGFSAIELRNMKKRNARVSSSVSASDYQQENNSEMVGQEHALQPATDLGEKADSRAREDIRKEYDDLCEQRAEAEKYNDLAAKERIDVKISVLARYLSEITGIQGKPVKMSKEGKKALDAVRNAIERAMCHIEKKDKPLAVHLRQSLEFGSIITYSPESDIQWEC